MATIVGTILFFSKPTGEIPSSPKESFKIPKPAGFGALAITVKPPPATAPATSEYFKSMQFMQKQKATHKEKRFMGKSMERYHFFNAIEYSPPMFRSKRKRNIPNTLSNTHGAEVYGKGIFGVWKTAYADFDKLHKQGGRFMARFFDNIYHEVGYLEHIGIGNKEYEEILGREYHYPKLSKS